ncbi:Hypothetical_protein [Hexamita inflata]|uniref:Hypothetical_protein n=1 Tax=Hexamita inflata TaxID=28002 RepID=A0AA86QIT7_9EUKA|nr:Hypothetical protein HINF_LOCUS47150 [Hexamita inflata]
MQLLQLIFASSICKTSAQVMISTDINVQEQCPNNAKCLNLPYNTFMQKYRALIPKEYQQYIDKIDQYATIKDLEMCNIWPADGCTSDVQQCSYFKQCVETCSEACTFFSGSVSRTITPNVTMFGIGPVTFDQPGMLYCGSSAKQNSSVGKSVGIAIGVIIAILLVGGLAFYVMRRNNTTKKPSAFKATAQMTNAYI